MSKALEIAEERLARGEIQKEEFEAIKAQLSNRGTSSIPTAHAPSAQASPAISKNGAALWVVLGIFVIFAPGFLDLNDLGWRLAGGVALVFFLIGGVKIIFGK